MSPTQLSGALSAFLLEYQSAWALQHANSLIIHSPLLHPPRVRLCINREHWLNSSPEYSQNLPSFPPFLSGLKWVFMFMLLQQTTDTYTHTKIHRHWPILIILTEWMVIGCLFVCFQLRYRLNRTTSVCLSAHLSACPTLNHTSLLHSWAMGLCATGGLAPPSTFWCALIMSRDKSCLIVITGAALSSVNTGAWITPGNTLSWI